MDDYELALEYETVNLFRRGGAAKIELNRPERVNAWNDQFSVDLLAAPAKEVDGLVLVSQLVVIHEATLTEHYSGVLLCRCAGPGPAE